MAKHLGMVLRRLVSLAVPVAIVLVAFLHARAVSALVDGTISSSPVYLPFAQTATATTGGVVLPRSVEAVLDRNIFDHLTGPLRAPDTAEAADEDTSGPLTARTCVGVHAVATVRGEDAAASLAALDVDGRHLLRRRGDDMPNAMFVAYIAEDRVWLSRDGAICQARVFADTPANVPENAHAGAEGRQQSRLESEVAKRIVKTGPNEYQIDRGAVDLILEAQTELMKTPLLPEKEGGRVVGFRLVKIRAGSVLAVLGLESGDRLVSINGIEVTSVEKMIEVYARLRTGTLDRWTLHVVRRRTPMNLDYVIK